MIETSYGNNKSDLVPEITSMLIEYFPVFIWEWGDLENTN